VVDVVDAGVGFRIGVDVGDVGDAVPAEQPIRVTHSTAATAMVVRCFGVIKA
jgi:hypothetical protein